jgi:hypothetical protein
MKLFNKLSVSQERGGPRKFTFEISMSGVISVGIVVVLGMCWVFILGILVGRGYRPEAAVPQIAQMMPTTAADKPDDAGPAAAPTVLKPEELQFMEGLQDKDGAVVTDSTQKSPADGKKAAGPKSHDLPDAKKTPMGAAPVATAIPGPPPAPPAAKVVPPSPARIKAEQSASKARVEPASPFEKKKEKDKDRDKGKGRSTASYQVASFPDKAQAETMVKELSRKGLSASVYEAKSKNRTMFRVKVQLKGTDAEIAADLKRTGEKGPILLGKKPL